MKKLILASGSPRRRELLAQIGLEFEVIVSDAEEIMTSTHPGEVVKELSSCKASAVALTLSDEQRDVVVIGSDTVVAQEHRILFGHNAHHQNRRMCNTRYGSASPQTIQDNLAMFQE